MIRAAKQVSVILFVSVCLILTIALCISATVISQDKENRQAETEYYRAMEREYVREVRAFLDGEGYSNSGVTMTEIVDTDGSRSYQVTIHHGRFASLSAEGREAILKECGRLVFADGKSEVSHKFLEEDL